MTLDSTDTESSDDNIFGDVISEHSRAQALADGDLVDVTETAREAGWRFPVAVTASVWSLIEVPADSRSAQDTKGRLWDVVWMASRAALRVRGDQLTFRVFFAPRHRRERRREVTLVATIGPGDDPAPVVTIMLPGED